MNAGNRYRAIKAKREQLEAEEKLALEKAMREVVESEVTE